MDISWEDAGRVKNSCYGNNISDWTFILKDGTLCPILRTDNFQDKTLTISAKDIAIIVNKDGVLKPVTFQNYLEGFGDFHNLGNTDLSLTDNDLVTIRFMAVIVPEDRSGSCEIVPTAYNYQTHTKDNPKNWIGTSFHEGNGITTDSTGKEKVHLIKTNPNGDQEKRWFKITNSDKDTSETCKGVLGTRSTGIGQNRVICYQIPRQQDDEEEACIVSKGSSSCPMPVAVGNVSFGSSDGEHKLLDLPSYIREPDSIPTLTFIYYYTTPDGNIDEEAAKQIVDNLEKNYDDLKGIWKGSLTTEQGEYVNKGPPIKLKTKINNPPKFKLDAFPK
jgi:hypothetical protein